MKKKIIILISLCLTSACTNKVARPIPEIFVPRITKNAFITGDGAVLPLRLWLSVSPPRAVILALHGFNDYSNFFNTPGKFLSKRGIISYAYDQRGFGGAPARGTWAGTSTYVRDAVQAARAIKKKHPKLPLFLEGSSMGGAIAILAAAAAAAEPHPPPLDGLVLAAPAVWSRATMPWYQRIALWMGAHILPSMTVSGRGLDIEPSDNHEMLINLSRDPLVIKETRLDTLNGLVDLMDAALTTVPDISIPTLVLYGERDEIIPKEPTFLMLSSLQSDRRYVAIYKRGYHMLLRDLQARTVLEDIVTWTQDRNAPLPSKADRRKLSPSGTMRLGR